MPCHVRSASLPRKRRTPSLLSSQPALVAMLDLKNEVERDTEKFLRRACSGRWPIWRLLGMQRHGNILAAAVEWLRCGDTVYALVEMALDKPAVHWRYFPTADAACSALATFDAQAQQGQPATPAAPTALKLK